MTPIELAELDLAVAIAEGLVNPRIEEETPFSDPQCVHDVPDFDAETGHRYKDAAEWFTPTRDPAEAMRLLEKYHFHLTNAVEAGSTGRRLHIATGGDWSETPCIAICRAVVALKSLS